MDSTQTLELTTDWVIALSSASMLIAVYISWLASTRTLKAAIHGSSRWFSLPTWAQIAAGVGMTAVGIAICYLLWTPLPISLSSNLRVICRVVGFVVALGGIGLWFWSRWALGRMMGVSTSSAVQLQAAHRLIQRGPYAHVRHPMYLSYWILLAGLLILYRTWMPLVLLIMTFASFTRRAAREEQGLAATFGDEWQTYAARVPKFTPRLPWRSGKNAR